MKDFDFLYDSFESLSTEKKSLEKQQSPPILYIVEDDLSLGKTIHKYLGQILGLKAYCFDCPEHLLNQLNKSSVDTNPDEHTPFCLISGTHFSQGTTDGLALIGLLKKQGYRFVSIVMADSGSIETAMLSTTRRVFRYLARPFKLEILGHWVIKALVLELGYQKKQLDQSIRESESSVSLEKLKSVDIFCGMVGRSNQMKKIFEDIQQISNSRSSVVITGAPGTGKKLVAKTIHQLSSRREHAFVTINCRAISKEILESELFGHAKGPLTGFLNDRKGRLELSHHGTLFLDRIEVMPLSLQQKLSRVLQEGKIESHGGTLIEPLDVRFIASTHEDLEQAIRENLFSRELFESLNVRKIQIPSLKERKEDIPLMVSYFLDCLKDDCKVSDLAFHQEALRVFTSYNWPDNVRELERLINELAVLGNKKIVRAEDLPGKLLQYKPRKAKIDERDKIFIDLPSKGIDLKKTLNEIENDLIFQALKLTSGNKNQASKLLNINRTTLIEKMKKKGLTKDDWLQSSADL